MNRHRDQELPRHVLKKFRIIYGSVRQHFREIEESCGVTGSQLWLLHEIGNQPNIGVSELAEKLSIHQSTCSLLVEKLVAHKLISKKRSREDQRRVGLCLTAQAEQTLQRAPGPAEGLLPEALQALPESALQALDQALHQVISQLQMRDDRLAEKPLSDI